MSTDCTETNLPVTDNTAADCESILSSNCIQTAAVDLYFQTAAGTDLTTWMSQVSTFVQAINILVTTNTNRYTTGTVMPTTGNTLGDTWYDSVGLVLWSYTNNGTIDLFVQISI